MTGVTPEPFLEIERTWDVDGNAVVPDWSALPGVSRVAEPEMRDLDARYYDTADAVLARSHVAVRRRTGGPDEGWHVKASVSGGRHEWGFPLSDLDADEAPTFPAPLVDLVARWAAPPFTPLARVRNARTAYALLDDAGRVVAEFVDDRVEALAERTGVVTRWREWELELGPAAPADRVAFFTAADDIARAAGASEASSDSKLARALGR